MGWWWSTAACVFTHCGEDQPRPLRPCHCETGKRRWFYPAAAWRCHSRGRVRQRRGGVIVPHTTLHSLTAAGRHLTTPALREAPAGGGWLGRRPVPVPQGQAVTAGKGPSCHTKAASRRFLPQTYRRPGPIFSLESRPVSFSAEKEMDLAPAAGSRTPGGTPPPWRGPPAPGPEGFWKILLPLVLPAQEEVRRNLIKVCDGHDHRSGRVPL